MKRSVYKGVDLKTGEESLFLLEPIDGQLKVNLFIVKRRDFYPGFQDQAYKAWRDRGERIRFPPHDHKVWDMELSPIMPEFDGVNRPEDRNNLSRARRREITQSHSRKHAEILEAEFDRMETWANYQKAWSYEIQEVDRIWELAVMFSRRINEARAKFGKTEGNDWREQISPEVHESFRERLDRVFAHMKDLRDKHFNDRKKRGTHLSGSWMESFGIWRISSIERPNGGKRGNRSNPLASAFEQPISIEIAGVRYFLGSMRRSKRSDPGKPRIARPTNRNAPGISRAYTGGWIGWAYTIRAISEKSNKPCSESGTTSSRSD